ncbi:MAG TPA: LysE family transporter [Cyclobacteriaceae bacterium]|nr:LysE family transporter [Cyclobacteriaceae bacterium]
MIYVQVFLIGVIFSFLGSIPPGTLNICVLQLGLEKKIAAALRFALAVSIIEYPYTWIGVQFEYWITSSPAVIENFELLTAVVMTVMGILNIWSAQRPTELTNRFNESGFRRGLVLSILNPMAIPFWIGITAYLKAQGWIDLSSTLKLHLYIFGTSVGAMVLLTLYTYLAHRLSRFVTSSKVVKLLPGITLLGLGMYAFVRYLF